ncbi:Hypothetical predicted protein, partial [Drosophila guanche]
FPDSPTEMLFPPYIAQPCKFACCRTSTSTSTSVPRYSQNTIRRSSPSSFSQCRSQCQTPPPPRPPPVGFEPTRVYQGQHSQSLAEKPFTRKSYTMVPIIKPSSSMPSGLAAAHPAAPSIGGVSLMQAEGNPIDGDISGSQYHSSQPNLLSNSFATPQHDHHRSSSNMNLHLNGSGGSGSTAQSRGYAPTTIPALTPTPVSRYGLRPGAVIERRSTPYYYHELLQKNVFDSSLNLLEKNKNSNLKLEQQQQQQPSSVLDSNVVVGKRAPMAKPQQRLLSGNPRSNYGGAGCYPTSSSSVSNLLGNGNGNGNDEVGSDGTLVDDDDGGCEDARNFSLAFNNLTNRIASLNNSSSSSNHNNNQNNNSSNSNNINNYNNNNNNNAPNNADSNNNVGQSNECIA